MCGIFGVAGAPELAERVDLTAALSALRHRGPDGSGTFWSRSVRGDAGCALAHTRLAVIDLSEAGRQPMTTPDGRHTLVYNGEIYNFRELRRELEAEGVAFRSRSDTEVLLHAAARWGADCVSRVDGMFAFALWDRVEGALLLARDRLGVKPLYYSARAGGVAFASEVRALLATRMASRALSPAGLRSYLAFGSVADPDTLLEDVSSLPPGHTLTFRDGSMRVARWWAPPTPPLRALTFDEAAEELRPKLRAAVRSRLVSDVPLGVFLSGGIDSSVVTGLAAEALERPVHTFTVTFDEERYNEEAHAAVVAAHFGCDHHQVHLPAARAVAEFDAALGALDQPSADGVNTFFVSKAAREAGLTVALSGLGGDEVFAGYPAFRSFAALRRLGAAVSILPAALTAALETGAARLLARNRGRKLAAIAAARGDARALYAAVRTMFAPAQIDGFLSKTARDFVAAAPVEMAGGECRDVADAINLFSCLELSRYLPNTLLRDTDATSMAHALEVRVPFLDHRVLEACAAIPGALKVERGQNKPLLVAAGPVLPHGITTRRKMGFVLPLETWLRGPLARTWRELESGRAASLFDPGGVRRLESAFLRGEAYLSHSRMMCLLALSRWCEAHGVSVPAKAPARAAAPRPGASRRARPRVLLALPGVFTEIGGIEMYNRLVVRSFLEWAEERGADCEVLVANDADGAADPRYLPSRGAAIRGFSRERVPFAGAVLARTAALAPDIVVLGHVNFARLAPALRVASPTSRVWYLTHGIEVWRRLDAITRHALRRADRIFSVSDFTRRELARWNGVDAAAIDLLPCALDPVWQEQQTGRASGNGHAHPPTLLSVARLAHSEKYKGIDSVIRAVPRIAHDVPEVRYVVIGDGDDRPRLEALARELGIEDRVDFRGRATPEALARAYDDCSLFVMPSSKEGFGIVFLEAALFGKPSIGGRHGGTPEVVRDGVTGILVAREDVSGLARAAADLLADDERRRRLGAAAHEALLSRFTYPAFRANVFETLDGGLAAAPAVLS